MIVMPPVEGAKSNAVTRRSSRLTAVVVAVAVACGLWAVIELVFGLDLRGPAFGSTSRPTDVGLEQVAIGSLAVSLAGWALLAALERVAARPRRVWTVIAVFVLLASLGGAASGAGVTTANRVSLSLLHLVVGVSLITLLRRTATVARDARPPRDVDTDRRRRVA